MKMTMVGRKMEVADLYRERAEKKLARLDRYFRGDTEAHVVFSTERGRMKTEITVLYGGMKFRAEEVTGDMSASIDGAVEALERQVRKNKTRLENRFKGSFAEVDALEAEDTDFNVIRVKEFDMKPMTVEDAILQMDLLGHQFFVFRDTEREEVQVVYRRKDGGYGLIVPTK